MKVLVTGAAGFIGFHTADALARRGDVVVGLDNLSEYYDVALKRARLALLEPHDAFRFVKLDLADRDGMARLFAAENFDRVIHLGAQPGVRYGLENPFAYVDSNLHGTVTVLEGCRHGGVEHLVFASTSSVYGANRKLPFSTHDNVDHPLSLYAATKKSNELMAHAYASLFGLPVTGLRFFTVYGPFGRPDMALFRFTKRILAGEPIDVFNFGRHRRDFTYIDDIVDAVLRVVDRVPEPDAGWSGDAPDPGASAAPYRLYNIGNQQPVELRRLIEILEQCLGRKADKRLLPRQPGDLEETWADVESLAVDFDFRPGTSLEAGVRRFVDWYVDFYDVEL